MKRKLKFYPLLLLFPIMFGLYTCELISDKNDECEGTKMESTEEPVIHLKVSVPLTDKLVELGKPEKIIVEGSIRKIYCSGKESGNFSYNPTYFVDDEMYEFAINNYKNFLFTIPKLFQYKFENTKDKLIVLCRVQIHWKDGLIYESGEYFEEYFFKDIKYDSNELNYYIGIRPKVVEYFQVNSP